MVLLGMGGSLRLTTEALHPMVRAVQEELRVHLKLIHVSNMRPHFDWLSLGLCFFSQLFTCKSK